CATSRATRSGARRRTRPGWRGAAGCSWRWPGSCTRPATSATSPSWPTPWRTPAVRTRNCWGTAARAASTSAAAGRWTCFWGRSEGAVGVTVCLPLFGNPGHELEEGAPVKGDHLRNLAAELQERLQKAAERLDKLAGAGWRTQAAMYEVILHHAAVQ